MSTAAAVERIRERSGLEPLVGVVLGSGLGGLADELEERVEISYADIPGWPVSTAIGHAGTLVLGTLDRVGEPSQAASENDAGARFEVRRLANALDGRIDVARAHVDPSATRVSYRETTSSTATDTSSHFSSEA